MRKSRLGFALVPALVAALLVSAGASATARGRHTAKLPVLKVALVAPSAHNDLAFTQSMYTALQALKKRYNLQISVSENEFVVSSAANIMRDYASKGYNLIIAHGSQYGSTIQQLAPQFPKTSFAWGTAGSTFGLKNVYAYEAASNEGGYVQGYMAALMSTTHVVGVIGPIAVGDAKLYIDGFTAGAKAENAKTTVEVSYTGSFSDPSLMSKQATEFVAQKADALSGSSQSVVGAITVAKAKGIPWFGTQWTQVPVAPKTVVSSQVYDWKGILRQIFTGIRKGKLGGSLYDLTLKNGGEKIQFNRGYKLAPSVRKAAQKVIAGITKGSIKAPA